MDGKLKKFNHLTHSVVRYARCPRGAVFAAESTSRLGSPTRIIELACLSTVCLPIVPHC